MKLNTLLISTLGYLASVEAIELTVGNEDSVCNAATDITNGIMDYYLGTRYGGTVGMFQQPYYWWEAGLAFGAMIDTWKFCDNDTYVETIQAAINHQRGQNNDFMAPNQTHVEANDDQVFWGFTVMDAAERNFPSYSDSKDDPTYAQLALNVYNSMAARWDAENCGGGLRWQIFSNMSGWTYKSEISNAGVFALAGRLARYTDNDKFVKTASRVLKWMKKVSFVSQPQNENYYNVYDGANIQNNSCPVINGALWSYNYALMMMGSAYLYNATGDQQWSDEVGLFLNGVDHYMVNTTKGADVLFEYQCDKFNTCNNDQRAFRAIVAKALGQIVQLVPDHAEQAMKIIDSSAAGAAQSCSGGSDGKTCGINWAYGGWDGWYGLGEQISALEIIQNTLIKGISLPCTSETCGEDIDQKDITTVPATTITRYFTETKTDVESSTTDTTTTENSFFTGN